MKKIFFPLIAFILLTQNTALAKDPVLLVPLPLKKLDSVKTWDIIRTLQTTLNKKKIKTEISATPSPEPVLNSKKTSLENSLKKAQDLQFNFQNKAAFQILEKALSIFNRRTPSLKDLQILGDAHLFFGLLL